MHSNFLLLYSKAYYIDRTLKAIGPNNINVTGYIASFVSNRNRIRYHAKVEIVILQ